MKKTLAVLVAVVGIGALAAIALAQSHGTHGGGMGKGMGHGMVGGQKMGGHSAMETTTQITEDKAKELAQQYADKNLAGFKVERVLPSTGMHHTMYSVELKNAKGEQRNIHITPFGGVMPFSGPSGHQGHS
jgi:hypothetical protein